MALTKTKSSQSRNRFFALAGSIFLLSGVAAGCASDPSDVTGNGGSDVVANKIHGSVGEWYVNVSAGRAEVGKVTFAIANFGTIQHEFLVVKTSFGPGKIPIESGNRIDEDEAGIDVIDEIPEWSVDEAKVLSVELSSGTYELLCNIEGHYAKGMHTSFNVE